MASRAPTLRREEAAGLVVAIAAHAALVGWLALKPPTPAPLPAPERMTVTFSDDVAEQSTAPQPAAEAAPAVAPVLAPDPVPAPAPEPKAASQPQAQPVAKVQPRPEPPKPVPVAKPVPQPQLKPLAKAQPVPVKPAATKPTPTKPATASQASQAKPAPAKPAPTVRSGGGGSRLGADFLKGLPGGQNPAARDTAPPADSIGQAVRSALRGAVARQLKPNWNGPSGVEVDKLATTVEWDLNEDGSLAGPPRIVSQTGVTDANRSQAERHKEQAIRAVRITRFNLPVEYYAGWKHLRFTFDWKFTQ